jgi:hypothetical protein
MCFMEPMLMEAVAAEVEKKVDAGDMFTALDVSRAVQAQGFWARHRHMKEAVHELFEEGCMGPEYRRTLCDVGGDHGPAWVYHAVHHHPAYYLAGLSTGSLVG